MIAIYKLIFTKGVYIGQTIDLDKRIKQHIYTKGKGSPLLEKAFQEYEYITYKVIEECKEEELDEKEIYWIKKLKPSLNTLIGGKVCRGVNHPRSKYTEEQILHLLKLFFTTAMSYTDMAKETNIDYATVHDICKMRSHAWCHQGIEDLFQERTNLRKSGDSTILSFWSPEGVEHEGTTQELEEKFALPKNTLKRLLTSTTGESKTGWTRHPTEYFTLTDPLGVSVTVTKHEARDLVRDLGRTTHNLLVTHNKPSKGWTCVRATEK